MIRFGDKLLISGFHLFSFLSTLWSRTKRPAPRTHHSETWTCPILAKGRWCRVPGGWSLGQPNHPGHRRLQHLSGLQNTLGQPLREVCCAQAPRWRWKMPSASLLSLPRHPLSLGAALSCPPLPAITPARLSEGEEEDGGYYTTFLFHWQFPSASWNRLLVIFSFLEGFQELCILRSLSRLSGNNGG